MSNFKPGDKALTDFWAGKNNGPIMAEVTVIGRSETPWSQSGHSYVVRRGNETVQLDAGWLNQPPA